MSLDVHAALSLEEVTVRYGAAVAVDAASFDLPRGQVLALLGPNGAGKTSLLQVCEGYRRPDGGRVAVLGVDPYQGRDWLMPKVGIMLQSGGLHPSARAGELLRLFASFAAHPLDVGMLADRLDLTPFLRTPYRVLSGGQRQRLALALAIVGRPELVLLDEPTAGMDVHARHTTWELVRQLRDDGVSGLLTTHLLDEAEHLADDVVIIHGGHVIATGSPAQLTAAAGIERLHVDAAPELPLAGLPGGVTALETSSGRYTVDGKLDAAAVAAVLAWFAARDVTVTGLQTDRRTLEDVFLTPYPGAGRLMRGLFTPRPGRAPVTTMLARHVRFEIMLTARRGDALVLSLAVPVLGMLAAGLTDVIRLRTDDRLGYVVPGAVALTVLSTAFTGQAITVGYERFYGVLKRLGTSPLTRTGLLAGKAAAIAVLVIGQAVVLAGIGVAAGWRPHLLQVPAALGLTLLAVAAYAGLALVLASRLRPETGTAAATLVYTLMLVFGGVLFPRPAAGNVELLNPVAAHAEALRVTLTHNDPTPAWAWYSLTLWAVCAVYAAARTFRWE